MKTILAAHAGSYPRIGDKREQQKLRAVQEAFDRGETGSGELEDARNEVVRQIIDEQYRAGLDVVSDGLISWHDTVSHMVRGMKGVEVGGLLRHFDTNTYFRQPEVVSKIEGGPSTVAEEFKLARAISPRPVCATLTGPLTLSRLSIVKGGPYKTPDALMNDLVPLLAGEVRRLSDAGAELIVVDESFLLREQDSLGRLADAFEVLGGYKGEARLWLRLSFGDASPLYEKLQHLAVDGLILDFTYSKALFEAVRTHGSDRPLGLGLVDARNTRLESAARTAEAARLLLRKVRADSCLVMCSNGLEYLPRQRAYEKLCLVSRVRDFLVGAVEKPKAGRRRKAVSRGKSRRRPARRKAAARKRPPKRARGRAKRPKGGRR